MAGKGITRTLSMRKSQVKLKRDKVLLMRALMRVLSSRINSENLNHLT